MFPVLVDHPFTTDVVRPADIKISSNHRRNDDRSLSRVLRVGTEEEKALGEEGRDESMR